MDCKIVVLGAGGVGKTALVIQTYDPTIEDLYRGRAVIDNQPCVLEVLDTAGQREYNALRDRWISGGEAFIIVYSISSRSTFERVKEFRDQILHVKNSDKVPIILVGNKSDKEYEREVTREEGIYMGRELGCEFIETSAKKCINVDKSFHTVVRTLIRMRSGRENKKTVSPKKDRIKFFKTSKDPIHLYDYKSFSNSVVIDDGAFGTISRAFSRKHNKLVVLKSVDLKHFTLEQLDNELKLHFKAKLHDNILGFYGITKEDLNDTIEDIDKYYNENGGNNQFDFNLTGQNNNVLQSDDLSSSKDISSLILERINSLERQLGNFGDPKSNQDDENISYKNGDTKSNQDYENISYKKSRCKCVVL
ncbi:16183_t:CDS:2 [Acaulospora morrowiae]|uniref:16183_t:CDS:1 n=1 Tax=Acaulospora morrowiae TaxID=94023 RepID=A0A9N9AJG4_9GLOM|nr:16183_t:CDS:2 [Acaulospora morrowiae]